MTEHSKPRDADLRVWWIPQIPMEPFYVAVRDVYEARRVLHMLAAYDKFQLDHNIKPDYCNVGGLCIYKDNEWVEWESCNGDDIKTVELHDEYAPPWLPDNVRVAMTQVYDDGEQTWSCTADMEKRLSRVDNKTTVRECYDTVRPYTNHQGPLRGG